MSMIEKRKIYCKIDETDESGGKIPVNDLSIIGSRKS